ncbi:MULTISPECIES: type II secretion system minor pseudopilin GspI [Enterobacter]|uniref:type II secretion system minor pseudopilin GspI n=1 Tax=Enterobacter TaxID=547 RepID=UPI0021D1CBEA|nr:MULTISPECIES: type II secretion system minor pseudopilin GspI [Enterobacter]MCU6191539.1 type II secretion system minor pseudopilin GspI [Enterobacter sichuanensis]MCX4178764.1 type II secretion system minor pseudopilin GspI [Enterobacter sp. HSTU-ASh6]
MTKRKEQGMTLLEVMVALVIFSTAALALMNSVSLNVRFTHGLGDSLQASWVAENQLAEAKLSNTPLPDALQTGSEMMGGRNWTWRKQRVNVTEKRFADEVQVFAEGDEDKPVITLQVPDPGEVK